MGKAELKMAKGHNGMSKSETPDRAKPPKHGDTLPELNLPAQLRLFKTPASIIPEREIRELLLELSGFQA